MYLYYVSIFKGVFRLNGALTTCSKLYAASKNDTSIYWRVASSLPIGNVLENRGWEYCGYRGVLEKWHFL